MEAFILYLIKSTVVSGVFYLLYSFLLRKESFFAINRYYLLISILFAYLFPFIKINLSNSSIEPAVINTVNSAVNQFHFIEELPLKNETINSPVTSQQQWWILPIAIVSGAFLFRFLKNLFQLFNTIHANEKITQTKFTLVLFNQQHTFSFFRYIFISPLVWNSPKGKSIVAHELSHAKHRHSLDRLFIEIMLIIFWMNPFIYLYRKALEEVHEFQADADATENSSVKEYFNLVLQQASTHNYSPLMSPFSYKLIKKRIKMANYKSNPVKRLLITLPIIVSLFILTVSSIDTFSSNNIDVETTNDINLIESNYSLKFILPISPSNCIKWGIGDELNNIITIKSHSNVPIVASQSGVIGNISKDGSIRINHSNGLSSTYTPLYNIKVNEGQTVNLGEIIGYTETNIKDNNSKLHFEIRDNDKIINPKLCLAKVKSINNKPERDPLFSAPIKKEDLIKVSSGFGMRKHPITKELKKHNGVDYVAPLNTFILAISDGMVRKVNHNFEEGKGYGRFIIIDHEDGYSSLYSQLNAYKVKEGQKVKKGDIIGLLGSSGISTGPHLHLEIKKDGQFIDPESVIK